MLHAYTSCIYSKTNANPSANEMIAFVNGKNIRKLRNGKNYKMKWKVECWTVFECALKKIKKK